MSSGDRLHGAPALRSALSGLRKDCWRPRPGSSCASIFVRHAAGNCLHEDARPARRVHLHPPARNPLEARPAHRRRLGHAEAGASCSAIPPPPSPRCSIGGRFDVKSVDVRCITRTCSNAGHVAGARKSRPTCAPRSRRSRTHWSRPPARIAGLALSINCRFSDVHRGPPPPLSTNRLSLSFSTATISWPSGC